MFPRRTVCLLMAVAMSFAAGPALCEVRVTLRMEHSSFLMYEPVNAYVKIHNDSNVPLVIHKEGNASIGFMVELKRGELAPPLPELRPAFEDMSLKPGEEREIVADISNAYDMREMGRYAITAVIDVGTSKWESNTEVIDVVRGLDLVKITRLVPGFADPRLARTFSLRYWPREGTEFVFICVDEEYSGKNYGVIQLGKIVRVFKPTLAVDKDGMVTAFHQTSEDCYTKSVFKSTKTGVRFVNQSFHLKNGDPYPTPPQNDGSKGGAGRRQ